MRISDWSSDVCSSDLLFMFGIALGIVASAMVLRLGPASEWLVWPIPALLAPFAGVFYPLSTLPTWMQWVGHLLPPSYVFEGMRAIVAGQSMPIAALCGALALASAQIVARSEEHTSELQSLMRISYAVFFLT